MTTIEDQAKEVIYILTQSENNECEECFGIEVQIIGVFSSRDKGLKAIKECKKLNYTWRAMS